VGIEPEVTFTGGVSLNIGMVKALEEKLGLPVNVCDDSHYIGAIGAAIFALERALGGDTSLESDNLGKAGAPAPPQAGAATQLKVLESN